MQPLTIPLIVSTRASRAPEFLRAFALLPELRFSLRLANESDLRALITQSRTESELVIIGGGDGTVSLAAGLLAESRTTLAVLPLGTTNNFARSIGYADQNPEELLAYYGEPLENLATQSIDLGTVDGRTFLNVASIGVSGRIARSVDYRQKKRWGRLAYALQATRLLLAARKMRVTLTAENFEQKFSAYQIMIFNGTHHAGLAVKDPRLLDSGRLSIVFVGGATPWGFVWRFLRFMAGKRTDDTPSFIFPSFTLTLDRERTMELDGEPIRFHKGAFATNHQCLTVVKIPT